MKRITLIVAAIAVAMFTATVESSGDTRSLPRTHANGHQSLAFSWSYFPVRQSPVEQIESSTCPDPGQHDPACVVTNSTASLGYGDSGIPPYSGPLGCAWDVDDNSFASASGTFPANTTISMSQCQVYDEANSPPDLSSCFYDPNAPGCGRPIGVTVYSSSAFLDIQICFTPGPCLSPAPIYDSSQRLYHYFVCVRALYPLNDPTVQEVPGSNGGRGVITNQILTVANPTSMKIRTNSITFAQVGTGQGGGDCAYDAPAAHRDSSAIFRWTISEP